MELTQVKGDTWVLEAGEMLPLYRLDHSRCILLDTGFITEREALEQALKHHGLRPVGVFASHAHRDHVGNAFWLREVYGSRLCLSEGEAPLCLSPALYRCGYDTYTPRQVELYFRHLIGRADEMVGTEDTSYEFCGVPFGVLHTPGHSPDHICISTPDHILYVGDALMAGEYLQQAKLPYYDIHETARSSMELLRDTKQDGFIVAHRAITHTLDGIVDENLAAMDCCYSILADLAQTPLTRDQLLAAALQYWKLVTSQEEKSARFERTIRTMMEYMVDTGSLLVTVIAGVRQYQKKA